MKNISRVADKNRNINLMVP